jgi:adenylosuccinate lyase
MKEKKLNAISPIDGRYRDKVDSIGKYFSEKALIYYRLKVEIEYFLFLCKNRIGKLKPLNSIEKNNLRNIYNDFSIKDALKIKKIEEKN